MKENQNEIGKGLEIFNPDLALHDPNDGKPLSNKLAGWTPKSGGAYLSAERSLTPVSHIPVALPAKASVSPVKSYSSPHLTEPELKKSHDHHTFKNPYQTLCQNNIASVESQKS